MKLDGALVRFEGIFVRLEHLVQVFEAYDKTPSASRIHRFKYDREPHPNEVNEIRIKEGRIHFIAPNYGPILFNLVTFRADLTKLVPHCSPPRANHPPKG